jgi:hypothetical protein
VNKILHTDIIMLKQNESEVLSSMYSKYVLEFVGYVYWENAVSFWEGAVQSI